MPQLLDIACHMMCFSLVHRLDNAVRAQLLLNLEDIHVPLWDSRKRVDSHHLNSLPSSVQSTVTQLDDTAIHVVFFLITIILTFCYLDPNYGVILDFSLFTFLHLTLNQLANFLSLTFNFKIYPG